MELDVIRVVAFSAVIAVHAIAFSTLASNEVSAGALMLLQFGRGVFFALTGFVLVYSATRRPVGAVPFWRRRVPYVVVPYAVWTVIYYCVGLAESAHPSFSLAALGLDILTGDAAYHLYFLVVVLQLYLLFPLILPFVRRSAGAPGRVLLIVGALNLTWLAVLQYAPAPTGALGVLWERAYELLPTYSIFVLAGCYAALHLGAIRTVVARRARLLAVVGVGAAGLAEAVYLVQLGDLSPRRAGSVLQPAMALSCVAAIVLVFLGASRWASGARRGSQLLDTAADISFGVYLAHPLVLALVLSIGFGTDNRVVPSLLATVIAMIGTAAGAVVVTLIARRTRASLALTGRRQLGLDSQPALTAVPAVYEVPAEGCRL
ncbi:MAG: acyltransferase [Actinomycetota bacterium]|nr:acyltransferase [Actinomycetota bacterium]